MYYPDLTPYIYYPATGVNILNVGWLDVGIPIPKAKPTSEFLEALFEHCLEPVNKKRGFHACPFCSLPDVIFGTLEEFGTRTIRLGSAEIHIRGTSGVIFASPDLIFHFVREHQYDPPEQFKEAIQNNSASR